jgi:hypothetical protein
MICSTHGTKRLIIYKTLLHLWKFRRCTLDPMKYIPNEYFSQCTVRFTVLEFFGVGQLEGCERNTRQLVILTWRFMKLSVLTRNPLYSSPHLSFTYTGFPVSSCMNGFGFTGLTWCSISIYVYSSTVFVMLTVDILETKLQ